jgi:hypothetical protein
VRCLPRNCAASLRYWKHIVSSCLVALCTSCLKNVISSSSRDSKQGFDCYTSQLPQRHSADKNRKMNHGLYGGYFLGPFPDITKRDSHLSCLSVFPAWNNSVVAGRIFMNVLVFTNNELPWQSQQQHAMQMYILPPETAHFNMTM